MGTLQRLDTFDRSRFWRQLEQYDGDKMALDQLKASVRTVAEQAGYIGDQIVRYLPQYTLHNKRHFLNVLAIMDALVPDEVMARLTPLECALCIMAAFTHDLGMALQDEEMRRIRDEAQDTPERRRFLSYRDGFGEELRQIERWRKKGGPDAAKRIGLIQGHILASYIRDTHTDAKVGRVERWLDAIAVEAGNEKLYHYNNYDFKHDLALIDRSHGRDVHWLRDQLTRRGREDGFYRLVGSGEWANLAFPGLLLRLADIMDFDATRTPRILFKHVGIENETSILEWNKHLSIVGWDISVQPEDPQLVYAAYCEHPVHEKSIREFASWIDWEIRAVRDELIVQMRRLGPAKGGRFKLCLPAKVELDVQAKGYPPAYIYEDIEFRLDQDEIQQLLLGESLWGDPQLCIRELLQNALDALQMRDLRLQLYEKGVERVEPVDPLRKRGGQKEELRVTLTWGHDADSGQDYIAVEDNGIGMTRDVVVRYFTQIGKSFYRSADFERERAALAANGLLATPISTFGIGILSCFMIADRLHVRTRPGGANNDERQPYDITISGPGSLFWLKQGTLEHQGTEVKLFLKPQYRIEHDSTYFFKQLREHFGYSARGRSPSGNEDRRVVDPTSITTSHDDRDRHIIDPALIAASHVVWPLYPIVIQPPEGQPIRIDERFHVDVLDPVDRAQVVAKAREWGCPKRFVGKPEWGLWEWCDTAGDGATGSRIRLWFPRNYRPAAGPDLPVDPPTKAGLCRQDELAALVEPQLSQWGRTVVVVKGMHVGDVQICIRELAMAHVVGCRVWVDLRGGTAPRLTADRQQALAPEDAGRWRHAVHNMFQRMGHALKCERDASAPGTLKNLLSGFRWRKSLRIEACIDSATQSHDLVRACTPTWKLPFIESLLWSSARLLQEDSNRDLDRARAHDFHLDRARAHALDRAHARAHTRDLNHVCTRALGRALAFDPAHAMARVSDGTRRARALTRMDPVFEQCLRSSWLQEAFWPDLLDSFPIFNCFHLRGRISDAMLAGPGLVQFEVESDCRLVPPVDLEGNQLGEIARFGYDLVFPMTSVPLGELRRQCPDWGSDRRYRQEGVAPLLVPGLDEALRKASEHLLRHFNVDRIFALLPRIELWSKPFAQWSEEDWRTCGLSALWDIRSGQVLWAKGALPVEEMRRTGLPVEAFLRAHGVEVGEDTDDDD